MLDLNKIREQISAIDKDLVALYEQRLEVIRDVAEYKISVGKPVKDEARELMVIQRVTSGLYSRENEKYVKTLYHHIMDTSCDIQQKIIDSTTSVVKKEKTKMVISKDTVVAYQGVQGAYSAQACEEYFGSECITASYPSFREMYAAVANGDVDYAVIPIENTTTGSVLEAVDLVGQYGCNIVGEKIIAVNHNLLGQKGSSLSDIRVVYSHPQALSQCSSYIAEHNMVPQNSANTAVAAAYIKGQGVISMGAIASSRAAEIYDLDILDSDIQLIKENYTRFFVITSKDISVENPTKASINFSVPNKPGALIEVMNIFSDSGVNLTKIESRPAHGSPFDYQFYIDFAVDTSTDINGLIQLVKSKCEYFKLLGIYKGDNV